MDKKYIVFSPYVSGFSNILMSFELALSLCYITGRSLIIPPTHWCHGIDNSKPFKKDWINIWDVCDLDAAREEFDIIYLFEHEEFKEHTKLLESHHQYWMHEVPKITTDYYEFTNADQVHKVLRLIDNTACFHMNQEETEDWSMFKQKRKLISVNRTEKYIAFNDCLFGYFWFQVYPGGSSERNTLKRKINKALRYQKKYEDLAKDLLAIPFNAIHARDSSFMADWDQVQKLNTPEKMYASVSQLLNKEIPLYISTDITDLGLFDLLAKDYKLIFLKDLINTLTPLEQIAIDQIICSNAEKFYGTYLSTFTKRINVLRGIKGLQTSDYMGINRIVDNNEEIDSPMPWIEKGTWGWYWSNYIQWTYE